MFNPLFNGTLVRLAAPLAADRDEFARWSQNDTYMRLLDDDPVRPQGPGEFAHFESAGPAQDFYFHLRTLDGDQLIGFVVLFNLKWSNQSATLAMGIGDPANWGQGYGQDALRLILNYAFNELNLFRVSLTVLDYNTRAIRAYERAGFVREGVMRQAVQRENQRHDLILYGILRDEWLS
jgi:RimJ/RimL family protein N-acetyltransferase